MQQTQNSSPKRSRRGWIILLLLSLLLLLGGAAAYIFTHPWWVEPVNPAEYHTQAPTPEAPERPAQPTPPATASLPAESSAETLPPTETTEPPLPNNPVDFAALRERNDDVCAWIYLPMGPEKPDIDLPILQPKEGWDENYYLHKDIDRKYLYAGCIYIQQVNSQDFSDRVTLVYGHNMLDGTMFSNLPVFRDSRFFDEHEFFYIYTPGHILTYRIAAAIQFDTRHILHNFDFSDDQVYDDWLQNYVLRPKTMVRNVRKDLELSIDDRLVILSTCLEHGASRYLIEGVLVSDEPTN
ncbi:MAG: sortase [Oscillospiraceae bacterium]|nr:sortase [Oscillospiraceae bacterium]